MQREAPDPALMYLRMDGRDTFMASVRHMAAASAEAIKASGRVAADIDSLVGHQANIRILRAAADQFEFPAERIVSNLDRVGNTSAASIPLALADGLADGLVKPGSVVLLTAFGAGFAWGSTVVTWPDIAAEGNDRDAR